MTGTDDCECERPMPTEDRFSSSLGAPATDEGSRLSARIALVTPFAVSLVAGWLVGNVGAVAIPMANAYHVSLAFVGVIASAAVATHAAMQIPAGRLVDRYGAHAAILGGLSVLVIANAAGAIAASPALAICARLGVGVGTALCFIGGSDLLRAQSVPVLAQGLYGGAGMCGAGLALALLPLTGDAASWRASWVSASALASAGLLLVRLGTPTSGAQPAAAESASRTSVLRDRELHRLAMIYTASYGFNVLVGNWVETFLERAAHYTTPQAAAAGALTLFGGIVSRPLGGWITHTRPWLVRPVVITGLLTGASGTALLMLAPPMTGGVLASAAIGFGAGLPFGPVFASAQRFRQDRPAAAVGLVNFFANAAVVAGIPVVGLTFSLPGQGRIALIALACLWAAAAGVVPSARSLTVSPPSGRHAV